MKMRFHPAQIVALSFLLTMVVGTGMLMLPISNAAGTSAAWLTAFFTAVSAVCVTGLSIVDTGTYWSGFGQVIIMVLFQIGGFGMMTAATLLGLMVNKSLRLQTKLIAQIETHSFGLGNIAAVAKLVFLVTLISETVICAGLTMRLHLAYDYSWGASIWSGMFHAVSAFNNAGFSIYPDSLMRFATDAFILLPIMIAIILGGLGFPVLYDLRYKGCHYRHYSMHTKLTLLGTAILLLSGFIILALFEWDNPNTLGGWSMADRLLSCAFASVSSRTAGFNTIDIGALTRESWALHYFLMFIGGGSAGTAGGVKVGTLAILVLLVISEIRGRNYCEAFGRRVGLSVQRQTITVLVFGCAVIMLATLILLYTTTFPTDQVIFEVISAFGTVGLSAGITADLPPVDQLVLIILMYVGRVGTITLAASLALSDRQMNYRYPEEHPIVG